MLVGLVFDIVSINKFCYILRVNIVIVVFAILLYLTQCLLYLATVSGNFVESITQYVGKSPNKKQIDTIRLPPSC